MVDDGTATTLDGTAGGAGSETAELEPGQQLGRYLLVERLGAGAMGVVWTARDPRLDREVAIKVVHPRHALAPEASRRLLREARAMAKVSHRGVVTVHDAGEVDGRLYIAMELVRGTTLGALVRARTESDLADWHRWLSYVLDAGRGLAAAHRQGVLHRDFKPDNVLVSNDGRVCVGDFGLASIGLHPDAHVPSPRDSQPFELTSTGMVLGTPVYMSPQQLRGEVVDERADQFAFCVAAWECLFGRRPFETDLKGVAGIAALASTIESSEITVPPGMSAVPSRIQRALVRGLAADPTKRWPSMDALVEALEDASARARAKKKRSARRITAVAALAVTAALAVLIARKVLAPAEPAVPQHRETKRLFDVSLRTRVAQSPDGKVVVLASNRLEVRELDGPGYWTTPLEGGAETGAIQFDGDTIRFTHSGDNRVWTWRYRIESSPSVTDRAIGGMWFGDSARGSVLFVAEPERTLRIERDGHEVARWDVQRQTEVLQVSPDGKRIAYLDGSRFVGRVVIRDLFTGSEQSIGPFASATALAWRDDRTLLYAIGTEHAELYQVTLGGARLSPSRRIHELDKGWIGTLAASPHRVLYVEMGVSSRTRIVDRPLLTSRDFDGATVAAPLAWRSSSDFLAWNRSTGRVELRAENNAVSPTSIVLASEPANATTVDNTLIVAMRGNDGRTVAAYDLVTGKQMWIHDDLRTFAVRCADDRRAPCFAIHMGAGREHIMRIDPATGALGETVYEGDRIEDLAVSGNGQLLAIVSSATSVVVTVDLLKQTSSQDEGTATSNRSVAFDTDGSRLTTGTLGGNRYEAAHTHLGGAHEPLTRSENDILSLIRPSPDGHAVLMLSRGYSPSVYELR